MPASTSTFGRLMQDIARFDGVPPNMSVRIATPSPESTRLTASMMSLRQRSESSSAPIVIASICFCGPMTCSSAALNSSARRPWVTSTRPIIGKLLAGALGAPHERATLTIQSPRARGDVAYLPESRRMDEGSCGGLIGRDSGGHMVTNSLQTIASRINRTLTLGSGQGGDNQREGQIAASHRDSRYFDTGNAGFQGFGRRQPLRVRGVEIDDETDGRMLHKVAAADSEPADLDQAGQHAGGA